MHESACVEKTSDTATLEANKEHNKFFAPYNLMYESDCKTKYSGVYDVSKGTCDINQSMLTQAACPQLKDDDKHAVTFCIDATPPKNAL